MESVDAVNKILEEANKRIQATGTGISSTFTPLNKMCGIFSTWFVLLFVLNWFFYQVSCLELSGDDSLIATKTSSWLP